MLTGKLLHVRHVKNRIIPYYLDTDDEIWLETAGRLIEIFRNLQGRTRGEVETEIETTFGADPTQVVPQGLADLLEDRCEFEVVSSHPPEQIREAVFQKAAVARRNAGIAVLPRDEVLQSIGAELGLTGEQVDAALFADLKSEQRLVDFHDISPEHLLQRYNVALAQGVLLRSTSVQVDIRNEPPQRYRALFRWLKFHRLICETKRIPPEGYQLRLDGPLSLFSATQKYGLQLALFLPAILLCRDFELTGELRWGPQRRPRSFLLDSRVGLVSHLTDSGSHVPPEMQMFVELFRKRINDWEITEESEVFPLGAGFWVPDFRLTHRKSGKSVLLEVLGFWRRSSAEQHLARLKEHAREPYLLAVSDQLHIDDAELEGLPVGIHRFRQMPLPDEVAKLADQTI